MIDCLGDPVDTPESDPPEDVESLSRLQGTLAERRMVTVDPMLELLEMFDKMLSDTLDLGIVT